MSILAACGVAPASTTATANAVSSGLSTLPSTSTSSTTASAKKTTLIASQATLQVSAAASVPTSAEDSSALVSAGTSAASSTLQQNVTLPTADSEVDSKTVDGESFAEITGTELVSSIQNTSSAAQIQCGVVCGQSNKVESIHTQQSEKGTSSRSSSSSTDAKSSLKLSEQSQDSETAVAQLMQPVAQLQTSLAVPVPAASGIGSSGLAATGAAPSAATGIAPQSSFLSATESASSLSSPVLDKVTAAVGGVTSSDPLASLDTAAQSGRLFAQASDQSSTANPTSSLRQPLAASSASSSVMASTRAVYTNNLSANGTTDGISSKAVTPVQAVPVQTEPVQANSGAASASSLPTSSNDLTAAAVTESSVTSRSDHALSSDLSTSPQSSRKSRVVAATDSDTSASDSVQAGTTASSSSYSSHLHEAVSITTNATVTVPAQHVTAGLADASRYSDSTSVAAPLASGVGAHTSTSTTLSSTDRAGSAQTSAQNTFSALDSGSGGQPVWTHTSARHAEAGYLDPDLGWVGVRADLNGHAVHATVVTSSSDAAQTLSQHMGSLGTYLQEQNSAVRSIGLASSTGQDLQNGMQNGASQDGSYSGNSSGNREDRSAQSSSVAEFDVRTISTSSVAGTSDSVPILRAGSRISLLA
ncbi:MAG: hypothetical protein P4K83_05025 [Terracidiphilus sp.]|nr:hypothetical protein [Terracidiphilus sp.]